VEKERNELDDEGVRGKVIAVVPDFGGGDK
jgi:hypothetical protein